MKTNEKFINPYTFVPIENANPDRKEVKLGDLTGVIECNLKTIDGHPLFIPDTENVNVSNEHKTYKFFSYDGKTPVIPGSELRGMVRNIYEQLTNSCFLITDEKNLPHKRTNFPKSKAIMIWNDKTNKWHLYTERDGAKFDKKPKSDTDINNDKYDKDGYLVHITGDIPKKKRNDVKFKVSECKGGGSASFDLDDEEFKSFLNVVDDYIKEASKKPSNNRPLRIYKSYEERIKQKKPILVYTDKNYRYLSPSCMTKEFFLKKIPDILRVQKLHHACEKADYACPACRLFGMIGKNQTNQAIKGRLRFTDGEAKAYEFGGITTLPILGTPRISSTEFYLVKPGADTKMWNYDYMTTGYTRRGRDNVPITKDFSQGYSPKLSGRKVYWHGKSPEIDSISKDKMNCTVHPLKSGEFCFKVYFEKLTDEELSNLIFCLTLNPANIKDDTKKCGSEIGIHKIGKGKPIGMGDISVAVQKVTLHKYKFEDEQISTPEEEHKFTDYQAKYCDAVASILAYTLPMNDSDAELVGYPFLTDKNGKRTIFNWFSNNRGSVSAPEIVQCLPTIKQQKYLREKIENKTDGN
jgi:CRISPR-associated protein (TIGR03986 family)